MTALIQHIPAPFLPSDPVSLFAAFEKQTPKGADASRYWSERWCLYVGNDPKRTTDRPAQEMRWFVREARARNAGAVPAYSGKWDNTVPAMTPRPMREVNIKAHMNASQALSDHYADLGSHYDGGESVAAMATHYEVSETAIRRAIKRRVKAGVLVERGKG